MRFSIFTVTALIGAALASPAPHQPRTATPAATPNPDPRETVVISKFKAFHKLVEGDVDQISFQLASHRPEGVAAYICQAASQDGPLLRRPNSYNCNGSTENNRYAFQINELDNAADTYNMTIYHQTSPFFGLWGQMKLSTVCRAEGVRSEICEQQQGSLDVELHAYE